MEYGSSLLFSYKRNDGEVDGARQGLCCAVSAIPGALSEDDLECLASDEVRDFDTSLGLGDKLASSVVNVASRTGKKNLEAMQDFNIDKSLFSDYC